MSKKYCPAGKIECKNLRDKRFCETKKGIWDMENFGWQCCPFPSYQKPIEPQEGKLEENIILPILSTNDKKGIIDSLVNIRNYIKKINKIINQHTDQIKELKNIINTLKLDYDLHLKDIHFSTIDDGLENLEKQIKEIKKAIPNIIDHKHPELENNNKALHLEYIVHLEEFHNVKINKSEQPVSKNIEDVSKKIKEIYRCFRVIPADFEDRVWKIIKSKTTSLQGSQQCLSKEVFYNAIREALND